MDLKCLLFLLFIIPSNLAGYNYPDSVNLGDVKVLTLYHGKMTNGRRSAPVPQLKCVGGSARKAFTPQVVQCHNQGFDGEDFQWECKTDMDNAYRFGKISVSCEGYSYPDDPYILKGSCGLEYTLDFTKEGYNQQSREHNYYGDSSYSGQTGRSSEEGSSFVGIFIVMLACCLVIYALYKTCIAPSEPVFQSSSTGGDFGGYPGGNGSFYPNAPPPPGFRSDYTSGASCGSQPAGANRAGGFWTGAATGGLLGYMFGNQGNSFSNRRPTTDYSRAFGGNSPGRRRSSPSANESSGTRTASGFGGTTRR